MEHDKKINAELKNQGWTVLRFWEKHQVLKDLDGCVDQIINAIHDKQ